jgi:hypothetical protein
MMNTKNLLIAGLIGGLISTALSNIPIINFVNCLLCAGFWAGALFAVWFYKRQTGSVTLGQAVIVGTVAGAFAGVFGFILSLVGLAGAQALMQSYAKYLPKDANIGTPPPNIASVFFNLIGVVVNIIFGAIGGLVGGLIFKPKTPPPTVVP